MSSQLPKVQISEKFEFCSLESSSMVLSAAGSTVMATSPLKKIELAHQLYRRTVRLRARFQKVALHSNRAACYLKLHDFKKAAEECTSVLELDQEHSRALMLRAQTLVTLKEYRSALFDVNRLLELDPSSEVYQNLQARLRTQLSLAPIPESEEEFEEQEDDEDEVTVKGDNKWEKSPEKDVGRDQKDELDKATINAEIDSRLSSGQRIDQNPEPKTSTPKTIAKAPKEERPEKQTKAWQSIPKPKGHSTLNYARWDSVEDDSSEDDNNDEDEEGSQPQYRFRVRTIGVRSVK